MFENVTAYTISVGITTNVAYPKPSSKTTNPNRNSYFQTYRFAFHIYTHKHKRAHRLLWDWSRHKTNMRWLLHFDHPKSVSHTTLREWWMEWNSEAGDAIECMQQHTANERLCENLEMWPIGNDIDKPYSSSMRLCAICRISLCQMHETCRR